MIIWQQGIFQWEKLFPSSQSTAQSLHMLLLNKYPKNSKTSIFTRSSSNWVCCGVNHKFHTLLCFFAFLSFFIITEHRIQNIKHILTERLKMWNVRNSMMAKKPPFDILQSDQILFMNWRICFPFHEIIKSYYRTKVS